MIFCHVKELGFIFNQGEKLHIFGDYKLTKAGHSTCVVPSISLLVHF